MTLKRETQVKVSIGRGSGKGKGLRQSLEECYGILNGKNLLL